MSRRGLPERFSAHADAIEREGRSPLYVELMRGAATSAASGGIVARAFEGDSLEHGSVPSLRLLAALHSLVLQGQAGELAAYYPSAGGEKPPAGAWQAAARALEEHCEEVRARIGRSVQTNEPGRCVASYGALLWLTECHGLPIRLLEIGASGGLCLIPDRYGYVAGGSLLGDPGAALVFDEPWIGSPVADPGQTDQRLQIASRAGCDLTPLDLCLAADRRTALSYIWPDEPERLERLRLAIETFRREPVSVEQAEASAWLTDRLKPPAVEGLLTVIWQSVVRQYLPEEARVAIAETIAAAGSAADERSPIAWVTMEPEGDHLGDFDLTCTCWPPGERVALGPAGNHGPPVRWS